MEAQKVEKLGAKRRGDAVETTLRRPPSTPYCRPVDRHQPVRPGPMTKATYTNIPLHSLPIHIVVLRAYPIQSLHVHISPIQICRSGTKFG